jgi:hypothetical protein
MKFELDGEGGPDISSPLLDWHSSLKTSRWNQELIDLLAMDFQSSVKEGKYDDMLFDQEAMGLQRIRNFCLGKLTQTHRQVKYRLEQQEESDNMKKEEARAKKQQAKEKRTTHDRRSHRRQTVSCTGSIATTLLNTTQLYNRRHRTVRENKEKDPIVWKQIGDILERLGVEGMSGDETDVPSRRKKTLRRVALPWLDYERPDWTKSH